MDCVSGLTGVKLPSLVVFFPFSALGGLVGASPSPRLLLLYSKTLRLSAGVTNNDNDPLTPSKKLGK